jgi:glycosyltransferase involved in cell wall biosynthesis
MTRASWGQPKCNESSSSSASLNGKSEMFNGENRKVAVLFHRLGPYHFARLRAAGRLLPIVAIESSGVDETYAWDVVTGADHFERVTLFDRADAQQLPAAEVAGRVRLALDKVQPAVVVVPGWADNAALGALRWCVQNHIPAVVMSDSTAWDERRASWKEWVKSHIVKMCAAGLVAGTPHKDYIVQLGMPAERVFLGYDAVDNEYFSKGAEEVRSPRKVAEQQRGEQSSVVRSQHGLPENYFLASARFVEKKNLPRLIEAYARYRTLCEDQRLQTTDHLSSVVRCPLSSSPPSVPWSLVLLGDGPLRETLNSQLSTLNLHGHVLLPGFKQYGELPAYYGLAKAFIHASTTEQWGLVVNEAMASGLPVLVSNRCGCAQDLVREGVNGFNFDPYNVEQLAQLMLKLSTLNSQLSALGSASREIISQWGPERFARGLHDAAETALKNPRPRAGLLDRLLLKALIYK